MPASGRAGRILPSQQVMLESGLLCRRYPESVVKTRQDPLAMPLALPRKSFWATGSAEVRKRTHCWIKP